MHVTYTDNNNTHNTHTQHTQTQHTRNNTAQEGTQQRIHRKIQTHKTGKKMLATHGGSGGHVGVCGVRVCVYVKREKIDVVAPTSAQSLMITRSPVSKTL